MGRSVEGMTDKKALEKIAPSGYITLGVVFTAYFLAMAFVMDSPLIGIPFLVLGLVFLFLGARALGESKASARDE